MALLSLPTVFCHAQLTVVNGGFESGFTSWDSLGNTAIWTSANNYGPPPDGGSNAAEMDADVGSIGSTFPPNGNESTLETFLGLTSGTIANATPGASFNEGSVIRQTSITVGQSDLGKTLSFEWNMITISDPTGDIGGKDYGFISLSRSGGGQFFGKVASIDGNTFTHDSSGSSFQYETGWHNQSLASLGFTFTQTGTYTLGFGVVSMGGFDNATPGFMVDNVSVVPEPGSWTIIAGCALGAFCLVRKLRNGRLDQAQV